MAAAYANQPVPRHRPSSAAWATERLPDGRFASLLKPPLPADEAAHEFVAWLRDVGELGEHSAQTVAALYGEYCELERRTPTPDILLLHALKGISGVSKRQARGLFVDGKRSRPTRWIVEPVPMKPMEHDP